MESREVPATFTVNDARDIPLAQIPVVAQESGPPAPQFMTLRAALQKSELEPGADIIDFSPTLYAPAGGGGGMTWLHLSALHGQLVKNVAAEEVTINGPGADVLGIEADATENNKFRILSMAGGKVTVNGLAFQKGWAAGDGGAIQVFGGVLALQSCHLVNNKADGHGGAVAHTAPAGAGAPPDVGPLTVVACQFSNNQAVTDGASFGGGIYSTSKNAPVTVQRSTFTYNTAGSHGGAISISSAGNAKQVVIENANGVPTNFLNNTAKRGGAIALIGNAVDLQVRGTTFSQNVGTVSGGGVYASGGSTSHLTFTSSTFTGNSVSGIGGTATGGAVELDTQSATFNDCTLTSNTAPYGGAIYVKGGGQAAGGNVTVNLNNTTFQNNGCSVLGPTICYNGTLNVDVWINVVGGNLVAGDIVAYQ